ncbi:MAG: hypothetical protein ABR527_03730, partial [Gemmatimonadota bacterium]
MLTGRCVACAMRLSVGWVLVAAACGGGEPAVPTPRLAPEVDSLARPTAEEIQLELETLGHEIADLEAYAGEPPPPATGFVPGTDPGSLLERARQAREAAERLAARGELEAAADSLTASAAHVEQIKR